MLASLNIPAPAAVRRVKHWVRAAVVAAAVAASASVLGVSATRPTLLRIAILAALAPLALAGARRAPRAVLPALVVWLAMLGLIRRLLDVSTGVKPASDPLLLVAPMTIGLLAVEAWQNRSGAPFSVLAKAVAVLCILAAVEALNPLQGGLHVGLAGLVLVLVPLLAFWIGRAFADDRTLGRVLWLVALLSVPAAVYGLWQTFIGLPPWDHAWLLSVGSSYAALNVGGVIRGFASFASSAEYAQFIVVGLVVWMAALRRTWILPSLAAVGLVGDALIFESSRSPVVLGIAALAMMLAARSGMREWLAIVLVAAAGGMMMFVAGHFAPTSAVAPGGAAAPASGSSALLGHQFGGLANPFSAQTSTLGGHVTLMVRGITSAFTHPLGYGTGSITIAAGKYGGYAQGTEVDLGNAGIAFGITGLLAYLVVFIGGLRLTYRLAVARRDWIAIAALGVLFATAGQWLNGGEYAAAWLPWLVLGWADRRAGFTDPKVAS